MPLRDGTGETSSTTGPASMGLGRLPGYFLERGTIGLVDGIAIVGCLHARPMMPRLRRCPKPRMRRRGDRSSFVIHPRPPSALGKSRSTMSDPDTFTTLHIAITDVITAAVGLPVVWRRLRATYPARRSSWLPCRAAPCSLGESAQTCPNSTTTAFPCSAPMTGPHRCSCMSAWAATPAYARPPTIACLPKSAALSIIALAVCAIPI